jgi:hypothetical protein
VKPPSSAAVKTKKARTSKAAKSGPDAKDPRVEAVIAANLGVGDPPSFDILFMLASDTVAGSGGFSVSYKGDYKHTKAPKVLLVERMDDEDKLEDVLRVSDNEPEAAEKVCAWLVKEWGI